MLLVLDILVIIVPVAQYVHLIPTAKFIIFRLFDRLYIHICGKSCTFIALNCIYAHC